MQEIDSAPASPAEEKKADHRTMGEVLEPSSMLLIGVDPELAAELAALAESEGCELVHLELKSGTLKVVLDRLEGGVTIEHCQKVARQASALLDAADFGKGRYFLEVGSPGLDRPLYAAKDYRRFQGHLARVTFRAAEDGARKTVIGRLESLEADVLTLVEEKTSRKGVPSGQSFEIPLAKIDKARLEIEL